jgi:hypothetical protein
MPLILALRIQRQENFCDFEASLVYILSSRAAKNTQRNCFKPHYHHHYKNQTKIKNKIKTKNQSAEAFSSGD